jgi:hypothetical protein
MKRLLKGHTRAEVAQMCHTDVGIVRQFESGALHSLDFCVWVGLASYYGRDALAVPFTVSKLEWPIAEVYFMYMRNGEAVQYAAKQAFKQITGE